MVLVVHSICAREYSASASCLRWRAGTETAVGSRLVAYALTGMLMLLKRRQLLHEACIGRGLRAHGMHHSQRFHHREVVRSYQPGSNHGGGAGPTSKAMHQDASSSLQAGLDELETALKVSVQRRIAAVLDKHPLVHKIRGEWLRQITCHAEHVRDAQRQLRRQACVSASDIRWLMPRPTPANAPASFGCMQPWHLQGTRRVRSIRVLTSRGLFSQAHP